LRSYLLVTREVTPQSPYFANQLLFIPMHFISPIRVLIFWVTLGLIGCGPGTRPQTGETAKATDHSALTPKYAKRFAISAQRGYILLTVKQAWAGAPAYTYALVPRGQAAPADLPPGTVVVSVPVQSIVCTSTTHAPLLEHIGAAEAITGFAQTKYLCSPVVRQRVAEGKIMDVGNEAGLNPEAVLALRPELVMAYGMDGRSPAYDRLTQLGVKVLLNADYMEETPLGRAEWVKVAGLLTGREHQADSLFTLVEKNYNALVEKTRRAAQRPTVFASAPYQDIWYMPGGRSFPAQLIRDAGGDYLWQSDTTVGSQHLGLEAVFAKAKAGQAWININPGDYPTIAALVAADQRFARFAAVQTGQVYNNDRRALPTGGNEYWELGVLRPDLVLQDLVKIFHPALLPAHELYFYRQLPAK
jgi:iron complex transport system substrate-binding protein